MFSLILMTLAAEQKHAHSCFVNEGKKLFLSCWQKCTRRTFCCSNYSYRFSCCIWCHFKWNNIGYSWCHSYFGDRIPPTPVLFPVHY